VSTLSAEAIEVRAGTKALISDVSLALESGEFLAVIGPNGAGKSTLLGALAGDRPLAKGDVLLDGQPMRRWNKRELAKRRAVLPQHSNVAFDFSGLQVAMLGLLAHRDRLSEPQMRARAEQALGETEALALADRPYTVLSGGERQRVQLARVLVQCDADPGHLPFLLLDEPIAGLDLSHQHAALASASRRADRGLGASGAARSQHGGTLCRSRGDHGAGAGHRTRPQRCDSRAGSTVGGLCDTDRAAGSRWNIGVHQPGWLGSVV